MFEPFEILLAVGSILVVFLLLSDIRDEFLRFLKPVLLRFLESAGVLTKEDYLRRSGIDHAQLQAIKAAQSAAGAFTKQVVQQQNGVGSAASSSGSASAAPLFVETTYNGIISPLPISSSATSHGEKKRRPSQMPNNSQAREIMMAANAAKQQLQQQQQQPQQQLQPEPSPSSANILAAEEAVGPRSPAIQVDLAAAAPSSPHPNAGGDENPLDADHLDVSRPASRSRVRKSDSRESQEAANAHGSGLSIATARPAPSPTHQADPAISQSSSAPAQLSTHNTPVSSLAIPATPIDAPRHLSPIHQLPPIAADSLQLHQQDNHSITDNGAEVSLNGSLTTTTNPVPQQQPPPQMQFMQPMPFIAGYPMNMLTVERSFDGDIPVEEYYNKDGEKVAWRRGTIWDNDFIYTWTKGLEFMKYGKHGSPHLRLVKFVLDDTSPSKQLKLDWGTGSILLDDVTEIRAGKTTSVFKRYEKDEENIPSYSCFSIVTPKRTLDLSFQMSKKQKFIPAKRDLLVFGLGEVTGTRPTTGNHKKLNQSLDSSSASGRDSLSMLTNGRNTTGGGGGSTSTTQNSTVSNADMGIRSPPIPYQKVREAIMSNRNGYVPNGRPSAGGSGGVLMNSISMSQPQQQEYSLSTRQSQYQSSMMHPGTPSISTSQYQRSQPSSPANQPNPNLNYSRPNQSLVPVNRGSLLATSSFIPTSSAAQQLLNQAQLQPRSLAFPNQPTTNPSSSPSAGYDPAYGLLPPPHFPAAVSPQRSTSNGTTTAAGGSSNPPTTATGPSHGRLISSMSSPAGSVPDYDPAHGGGGLSYEELLHRNSMLINANKLALEQSHQQQQMQQYLQQQQQFQLQQQQQMKRAN